MSRRILIAVDLGTASETVVHTGLALARAAGAEPFLIYTYLFAPPSPSAFYPTASRALYEQAMLDLRHLTRDCGHRLEDRQLLARSGPAARMIVETARELAAELIVVGTRQLRGLERLLAGSTAEAVVRRASCPVLVVPCVPGARTVAKAS